jgi:hypothetical protein
VTRDGRLYAKFDLGMDEHPKIMLLTDRAFRALIESTLYARRQLTDGYLDQRVVERKWGPEVAAELSSNDPERPSWARVEGGWMIHDFAEHQTTTLDIQAKREAGRKGGLAKAERTASTPLAGGTELLQQNASKRLAKTETETETETETRTTSPDAPRPDVEAVIDYFSKQLTNNDVKHTTTPAWKNAARLLIDKDGYTTEQINYVTKYATTDEFWKTNILSLPKLREKFEQLKLKAQAQATATKTAQPAVPTQYGWANK